MSRSMRMLCGLVLAFFVVLYLSTQSQSIFGGDAGDLVTAAYTGGVAHPPGYPLYTFFGYLLSHIIPFGSVAWRVSLLSSLSIALALSILFVYIAFVTASSIAAFVAVLTLGTSYLYWLYAVVPEVFGLHIFFVAVQLLALLWWQKSHSAKAGLTFVALFVLSLSHHHIILFMLPAYIYALFNEKAHVLSFVSKNKRAIMLTGALSLLPIAWFIFSIPHLAAYTWEDTLSVFNILKIISRAAYGSFTSAVVIVEKPISRLTDVYAYFTLLIEDITLPAFLLALTGGIYEFYQNKKRFVFHFLAFMFTGPIYIFYAAYILSNSFTIATFERFSMPSYVFVTIWVAFGVVALIKGFSLLIQRVRAKTDTSPSLNYIPMIFALCLIIPINLLFINYPKISVLKNDETAEKLAMNILDTADKNAILLLTKDNEIFNVSYLHLVKGYRPDVAVINKSHLFDARRFKNIEKQYPDLIFPDKMDSEFDQKFIMSNAEKRPIYTNSSFPIKEKYVWIREGLLYKLFSKEDFPSAKEINNINNALWSSYHDPYSGSLGQYKHLMLASNLLLYRIYRAETADYFYAAKNYGEAEKHYAAALRYDDNDVKIYQKLAAAQMDQKKCVEAEDTLKNAYDKFPSSVENPLFLIKLYTDCLKDENKVKEWRAVYDSLNSKNQQKLEQL